MKAVGVDIGGTFTDFAVYDEETQTYHVMKIRSTPENPALAMLQGFDSNGVTLDQVSTICHGTTVTTNAVIQKKWSKTALITTKGFRDILEYRRTNRGDLYDVQWTPPRPLIERELRKEVRERTDYSGKVLVSVDPEEVEQVIADLHSQGIESVAVVFLHSYINPENEFKVRDLIQLKFPNIMVTASAELMPEWREFERTSTAVVNAYVGPILKKYLDYLVDELSKKRYSYRVLVMLSNGGLAGIKTVSSVAALTLKSGPAGGVIAQQAITTNVGIKNSIGLDMGGTSADVAVIREGGIDTVESQEIEFGTVVALPTVDIISIGAGGGSVAWIDQGGALHVGPQSAGAMPGPACYGSGGTEPTVTDANLFLGRLGEKTLVGGALPISKALAERAISEKIARPLGIDVVEAAYGIIKIAVNNMANAIKLMTVQRGLDPRGFVLFPYGGAGPMHAVEIAKELEIDRILVPPHPGATSAYGLLSADLRYDFVKTVLLSSNSLTYDDIESKFQELEGQANARLAEEGIDPEDRHRLRSADVRYWGQTNYLNVPVQSGYFNEKTLTDLVASFADEHQRFYGYKKPAGEEVEIVNIRVTGFGLRPKLEISPRKVAASGQHVTVRDVYFENHGFVPTKIYRKDDLPTGLVMSGPAVVEIFDSTVVVTPEDSFYVDEYDNMFITVGSNKEAQS